MSKEETRDLIVKLLVDQCEYDVNKVEIVLFNMVGLVATNVNEDIDHVTKQEFFRAAREPVVALQKEFDKINSELADIKDTESDEWKSNKEKLNEIRINLIRARRNAAKDIFERVNSYGNVISPNS